MAQRLIHLALAARPLAVALAFGTVGGLVFVWLRLPLPWMLGAMTATTLASLAGVRQRMPPRLRAVMVVVIGIMLGSSFTPDILDRISTWMISLAGVLLYVVVATGLVMALLRRWQGRDAVTSVLCATPGGATEMAILGHALGADDRTIALSHAGRVLIVMLVLPFWFRFVEGYVPPPQATTGLGLLTFDLTELALLAACGVVGAWGAFRLRVPVPAMLGPLALSAAAHLSGLSEHQPPWELVATAQVVLGTAVGCRFTGVSFREILRTLAVGFASAALLLSATVVFAYGLHHLTGLSTQSLVLAFAPGGLVEMNLIALAMGIDPAFVSTHHTARIIIIVVLMPMLIRWFFMPKPPAA